MQFAFRILAFLYFLGQISGAFGDAYLQLVPGVAQILFVSYTLGNVAHQTGENSMAPAAQLGQAQLHREIRPVPVMADKLADRAQLTFFDGFDTIEKRKSASWLGPSPMNRPRLLPIA